MLYQAWRNIFFLRGLAQCSLISITDWSSESENTAPYWTNEVPWNQFYFNFELRRLFLRQTLLQWLQNTFLKNQSRKISLRILSSSRDFTSNRYPFVHDWKWLEWYQMSVTLFHRYILSISVGYRCTILLKSGRK